VGPRASLDALEKKTSLASFKNQTVICQLLIPCHGADQNYNSKLTTSSLLRRGTAFLKSARNFSFNKNSKTVNLSMRRWWSL